LSLYDRTLSVSTVCVYESTGVVTLIHLVQYVCRPSYFDTSSTVCMKGHCQLVQCVCMNFDTSSTVGMNGHCQLVQCVCMKVLD